MYLLSQSCMHTDQILTSQYDVKYMSRQQGFTKRYISVEREKVNLPNAQFEVRIIVRLTAFSEITNR